jgi:hypothetical protein
MGNRSIRAAMEASEWREDVEEPAVSAM